MDPGGADLEQPPDRRELLSAHEIVAPQGSLNLDAGWGLSELQISICRSWDQEVPKDEEDRVVVIPPELRPHLVAAMDASPSERVFCRSNGKPFDPSVRNALVGRLRRALGRAGIVDRYRHKCRRKGCGFEETRPLATESRCPKCNMRLWMSPIPRPLRWYDLRHSHTTLLRKAGVDLGAVQKSLGHSSPELTAAVYDHSGVEDYRADVERALSFEKPARVDATSMQRAGDAKSEAPGAEAFACNSELCMVGETGFEFTERQ